MDKKEWMRHQLGKALEQDPSKIEKASSLLSTLSKIYDLVDDVCATDDDAIQLIMRGANDALVENDAVDAGFSFEATNMGGVIKFDVHMPAGGKASATVGKHGSKYEAGRDIVSDALRYARRVK